MKTVKILFSLAIMATAFIGCKSDDERAAEFDSIGLILGLDEAHCACCGNWVIKIDGEQNPHQFLELPNNSGIDLNTATFPISVSLNWIESSSDCRFALISDIVVN